MSLMNRAARLALAVLLASWFAPPASANPVDDLLERIDAGASRKFVTVLRPSTADYFELSQQGSRVRVEGNTWVNIAAGIHWYLKHYAGVLITWNNMHPRLPRRMPAVPHTERHVTPLARRYCFNYCTFSYSMAFWDWNRWQEEIDWMALHGINMPLAATGEEVAWRNMLLRLGYTNDEVGRFIAGPAFLAWWAMNNLEGWGGPLPDSWYARQEALQKKILRRERALGMHPVLPGYSGMLPHDAKEKLGVNVTPGGLWNGYTRPATVAATDPAFDRIADLYYQELTKLYGRADYYSMDPFHESADNDRVDYAACGRKLMAAMKRANANAVWVVQGWTENPRPEMADSLPGRDLLVLDLFSECRPMFGAPSVWRRDKGYGDHPWLFCMLENFGANVGLHGRMDQLIHNFALAASRTTPLRPARSHLDGWGLTMEGIQNNPVMFELMSELPWMCDSLPADNNLAAFRRRWLNDYVFARYGTTMPALRRAWQILGASIYNCPLGNNQQGPHESIFDGRPSLDNFQVKSWSKMHNYYDPDDTYRAACLMTDVADSLSGNNIFEYDLVDVVRQALDDQARLLYLHVVADYKGFDRKAFSADSAAIGRRRRGPGAARSRRRTFMSGTPECR